MIAFQAASRDATAGCPAHLYVRLESKNIFAAISPRLTSDTFALTASFPLGKKILPVLPRNLDERSIQKIPSLSGLRRPLEYLLQQLRANLFGEDSSRPCLEQTLSQKLRTQRVLPERAMGTGKGTLFSMLQTCLAREFAWRLVLLQSAQWWLRLQDLQEGPQRPFLKLFGANPRGSADEEAFGKFHRPVA